jgi:hypothetical protein
LRARWPIANTNTYICAKCNSNCIPYTYADADAYANAHADANAHAMHRKMPTDSEAAPNSKVTAYSASSHNTRATAIFSATYSGATSLAAWIKSCNRDRAQCTLTKSARTKINAAPIQVQTLWFSVSDYFDGTAASSSRNVVSL